MSLANTVCFAYMNYLAVWDSPSFILDFWYYIECSPFPYYQIISLCMYGLMARGTVSTKF